MNIYTFRIIIDIEEDVFRDIEIATNATFLDLHKAIKRAFEFEGQEMASFYMSNEHWDKGEEIPLEDMGLQKEGETPMDMPHAKLSDFVSKPDEKILYVYDFLRMWIFYVELQEVRKAAPTILYPNLSMKYGDAPAEDSKEVDLFADFPELEGEGGSKKQESTGDPELDAYLNEEEDEFSGENFESLDDLDDYI